MLERVRNVIKRDAKRTKRPLMDDEDLPPKKKMSIKGNDLLRRYPISNDVPAVECEETLKQHERGISKELAKAKPRDSVLLPLLRSTYAQRRLFILNEAESVGAILDLYPALSRQSVVRIFM